MPPTAATVAPTAAALAMLGEGWGRDGWGRRSRRGCPPCIRGRSAAHSGIGALLMEGGLICRGRGRAMVLLHICIGYWPTLHLLNDHAAVCSGWLAVRKQARLGM